MNSPSPSNIQNSALPSNENEDSLQSLVAQLSSQIDFNNNLLSEMSKLENTQLDTQNQMKSKQMKLKTMQQSLDGVKSECGEWRRKFTIAQEIADGNSVKLNESRSVINSQKDAIDMTNDKTLSLENTISELKHTVATQFEQILRSREASQSNTEEINRIRSTYEAKLQTSGNTNTALLSQNEALQRKFVIQSNELSQLKTSYVQKTEEAEQASDFALLENRRKEEALLREKALEDELARVKYGMKIAQEEGEEQKARCESVLSELNSKTEELDDAVQSEMDANDKFLSLKKDSETTRKTHEAKAKELETLHARINVMSKLKAETTLHYETQLANSQEKTAKLLEEMRTNNQSHAVEVLKFEDDAGEVKMKYEGKLLVLQKETTDLHDALAKSNSHYAKSIEGMAEERKEYESKIKSLSGSAVELDIVIAAMKEEKSQVANTALNEVKSLKETIRDNANEYIDTMDKLKAKMKTIEEANVSYVSEINEISTQFITLSTFAKALEAKQSEPIEAWYNQVVSSFETLIEQNEAVKNSYENAKDDVKRAQMCTLDEQGKSLTFEEEVSRLEYDVTMLKEEARQGQLALKDAVISNEAMSVSLKKANGESRDLLELYKEKLTASERRSAELQNMVSAASESLDDTHKSHAEKVKASEERGVELDGQLKRLRREQVALLAQRDGLQKMTEDRDRDIRNFKRDLEEVDKRSASRSEESEKKLEKMTKAVADANRTTAQISTQCEQTKKLMLTIQQQRNNLSEEVKLLKEEVRVLEGSD